VLLLAVRCCPQLSFGRLRKKETSLVNWSVWLHSCLFLEVHDSERAEHE
jgi:hypothetical protein